MTSLAALAAAALLAGLSPRVTGPLPGGTGDVLVEAGSARWDGTAGTYHLEGGVVLRRGAVVLRARSADFDPATNEVHAVGGVLLTDATRAVAAEGVRAVLDGPFEADGVVAFLKDGAVALGGATTAEEARRIGRNRLTFSGDRLRGEPSGRLRLGGARVTLCDCGGGLPSWELRAREADVIPGERAVLTWPVLYVTPLFVNRQVPVFVLPWFYLPLGERQTGLLPPVLGGTGATGVAISQPLFVTLGRSADLTLSPEYAIGRTRRAAGNVRGPGARLELRWAPAPGAVGEVELHAVHDLDREPGGAGGERLGIVGTHAQRLGDSTRLRLDLSLASDPVWFRDLTGEALARSAFYSRSDALLSHRSDSLVLEASAAYLEPLTPVGWVPIAATAATGILGRSFGVLGRDVPVFHRWPSAAATLLPSELGPLTLSGRLGASRFAPARDVDVSAGFGPGDPGFARWLAATPLLPAVPRLAATRGDARLEVAAPLRLGAATLEPWVRGAAVGYAFDADARDDTFSAWAVGGATLSTELSRHYGTVTHAIAPRLELRAGTDTLRRADSGFAFPAYDGWDRVRTTRSGYLVASSPDPGAPLVELPLSRSLSAAPDGSFRQLRASVENRIEAGAAGRLRLELGQDYDLGRGRFAETFAVVAGAKGPLSADASARVLALDRRPYSVAAPKHRSPLDALTELRAGVAVAGPRGSGVHAALLAIGPGASGALMAGVDPLFDLRPAVVDPLAQASVGGHAALGGATLAYDAIVLARAGEVPRCSGEGGTRTAGAGHVYQQAASLLWESPCHCFGVRAIVRVDGCGSVSPHVTLDLSQLGERAKLQ